MDIRTMDTGAISSHMREFEWHVVVVVVVVVVF